MGFIQLTELRGDGGMFSEYSVLVNPYQIAAVSKRDGGGAMVHIAGRVNAFRVKETFDEIQCLLDPPTIESWENQPPLLADPYLRSISWGLTPKYVPGEDEGSEDGESGDPIYDSELSAEEIWEANGRPTAEPARPTKFGYWANDGSGEVTWPSGDDLKPGEEVKYNPGPWGSSKYNHNI